jgi:hypothetical protein
MRKRAKTAWQTPYASRTPEASDAKTAQTRTTESLTETFLNFRLPLLQDAKDVKRGRTKFIVTKIESAAMQP